MLWALAWTVLGVAGLAVLALLVRRDVRAVLALLRELTLASEQLDRLSAATAGPAGAPAVPAAPGVDLPAALGGLRAAGTELRRYLDGPSGPRCARTAGDGRTMQQQRPPLEV